MRPIEKTASDLFQKLRTRYSPVTLGNDKAESTSDPESARFFNFVFKESEEERGPVSISLVDGRSMKVFFGEGMTDKMQDVSQWYNFLRELRAFAKRNLLLFDARNIAKSQLDTRDFGWLSKVDGKMDEKNVSVSESTMWGSKRRSYQALESVRMIVQHSKSVDESIPGARSRSIQAIYLERSDGERYKFPYNYLTGARAMARHISEGGTPYDPIGQHVLGMIKEMRDLSKFARMSKKVANEDESAAEIRQRVVERFHGLKGTLGALSHASGYNEFKENFKPQVNEEENQNLEDLRERFTRKIWDNKMEELLPAVVRALESAEVMEAPASVEKMIKDPNRLIVLKKDPAADAMIRNTKFNDAMGLMGFVLSDIATRAIGDDMDALANFAADVAERVGDQELDSKDRQLGMLLAKRYIDDIKKMATDEEFAKMVRKDPSDVYGKKRKLGGGFHEAEEYESWAEDIMPEIAREGSGDKPEHRDDDNQDDKRWDDAEDSEEEVEEAVPQPPVKPGASTAPTLAIGQQQQQKKPTPAEIFQAAKNVTRVAQAAGMKNMPAAAVAKTMGAMAAGKPPGRQGMGLIGGLGNTIMQAAAGDPRKAARLTDTMRRIMRNEGEDAAFAMLQDQLNEADKASNAEIAQKTNDLIKMNPQIKNPNLIYPGQTINTPQGAYIVGKDDNLWNISKGMTKGQFVPTPPTREVDPSVAALGTTDASRDPANPVIKNIDVKFGSDDTVASAVPVGEPVGNALALQKMAMPGATSLDVSKSVPVEPIAKPGEMDFFSPTTTDVGQFKDGGQAYGTVDPTKFTPGDPTKMLRQDATSGEGPLAADAKVNDMIAKLRELAGLK